MMKGATLICLSVALCFQGGAAAGGTFIVESGGSISGALEAAAPFDTVVVRPGTYREGNLSIKKPIWLLGQGYPVIDAPPKSEIFNIFSDSVWVEGFQLQSVGISFLKELAAIRISHVSHVTIRNNKILNSFFGIYIQYGKDCVIENNHIRGGNVSEATAGNAIHVWKADHIRVADNTVENHRDGIYFEFVDQSLISGNRSLNNLRYGLHFMFSNDDVYIDNVFRKNGAGVAVMFSKRITMRQNRFEQNWGGSSYGILLKEISHGTMSRNVFHGNTVGIYAEGATAITIDHNDFISNGKAIDMKGNCLENEVKHNNFYSNTFEVYTNTKSNNNTFDSNYWSQYNGYDLNKDGIGDHMYRPVNLMALITNEVPAAYILLHSFLANTIDIMEKNFPDLIPETLTDSHPMMRPVKHD